MTPANDTVRTRTLNKPDLYAGIVVAVVGLAYYLETLRIAGTADVVGPGTLPAIVGLGLTGMGILLAISAFRVHKPSPEEIMEKVTAEDSAASASAAETEADHDGAPSAPTPVGTKVLVNFAVFFAYLFIFIPVGFLLSTAVFLFAITSLYNRRKWLRNLIYSVCISAAIYFSFKYALGVYLPPGILG